MITNAVQISIQAVSPLFGTGATTASATASGVATAAVAALS